MLIGALGGVTCGTKLHNTLHKAESNADIN